MLLPYGFALPGALFDGLLVVTAALAGDSTDCADTAIGVKARKAHDKANCALSSVTRVRGKATG